MDLGETDGFGVHPAKSASPCSLRIDGFAGRIQTTSDTVTLSGANTNSGAATVSAGVLALTGSATMANTTLTIESNATLDVSGLSTSFMVGGLSYDQSLVGSGVIKGAVTSFGSTIVPGGAAAAGTLSFSNDLYLANATLVFDMTGTQTAGGGVNDLIQMAGGTLTLSGVNKVVVDGPIATGTYTILRGATSIVGFAENFTAVGPRGTYTFDVTSVPGSVLMTVSTQPAAALVWQGSPTNLWDLAGAVNWSNAGSPDAFHYNDSVLFNDTGANGNPALSGLLYPSQVTVSNSSLTYAFGGSGTLILSNANTFTGPTVINGGTVQLANGPNRLPVSSPVTIDNAAGATLDLKGNNQTLVSLSGGGGSGGTIALGTGVLTVNQSADTTYAGGISGTGSLGKRVAGRLVLSGTVSHSGNTTVSEGELQVNGTLTASAVTVTGGVLSGTGTIGAGVSIQPGGVLAPGKNGIGTLILRNSLALSGATSFQINKSGSVLTSGRIQGMNSVTYGGSLTVSATGDVLAPGDKFTLFSNNSGAYAGGFAVNTLPALVDRARIFL